MEDKKQALSCPFCGSTDIRHSLKTHSYLGDRTYHSAMYCNKCRAMGPRVLMHISDVPRMKLEQDISIYNKAVEAWNKRIKGEK